MKLKNKEKKTLWNSVFNHIDGLYDQEDHGRRNGRYSSTKRRFNEHLESVEQERYGKTWEAIKVLEGYIRASPYLEKPAAEMIRFPRTGTRYLLVENRRPPHVRHDDFEHGNVTNRVYVFLVTGEGATTICGLSLSHGFVVFSENYEALPVRCLKMKEKLI